MFAIRLVRTPEVAFTLRDKRTDTIGDRDSGPLDRDDRPEIEVFVFERDLAWYGDDSPLKQLGKVFPSGAFIWRATARPIAPGGENETGKVWFDKLRIDPNTPWARRFGRHAVKFREAPAVDWSPPPDHHQFVTEPDATEWTRADDILFAYEALPSDHPVRVASQFVSELLSPEPNRRVLETLISPESLADWGDFDSASRKLKSMQGVGFAQRLLVPTQFADVLWIALIDGVPSDPLLGTVWWPTEFVNMNKREDLGRWVVHAIGERIEPEDLPRG